MSKVKPENMFNERTTLLQKKGFLISHQKVRNFSLLTF